VSDQTGVLDKHFNLTDDITLTYDQNIFTIRYAAREFDQQDKINFAFQLEGFDRDWQYVEKKREATYTNLPPKTYTFKVKCRNEHGFWGEPRSLSITVLPPWHRTWPAYFLWAAIVLGSIYRLYRFQLTRRLAQAETRRLKELDTVKTRLYTNITHEFRTPLTVILGMADRVTDDPKDWFSEGMRMIKRNGRRLLLLVNQMLDLARLESGSLAVNSIQADVVSYLRYIHESFHSFAEVNGISLHFRSAEEEVWMDYDPGKLLDIFSNLISNAVKFTPAGGQVHLQIETIRQDAGAALQVEVKDTGIGIAEKDLPNIFDRFYQVDDTSTRKGEGTGIGLALAKELVKLLGGRIDVVSQEGKGATFIVLLPITNQAAHAPSPVAEEIRSNVLPFIEKPDAPSKTPAANPDRPLLLIIEDNLDVIRYLSTLLEKDYQLITATDGQAGIDKALEYIPDIIISDVMMPEKDGFEVCNTLKQDERTSHIPIILLTAKADADSRLTGLRKGADDYLAKPFNKEELNVRMHNLIELRRKLQQRYGRLAAGQRPEESVEYQMEDQFLQKVRSAVEAQLTDPEFDIAELAKKVNMSRSQLFRKLKALTDKSPSLFVRSIRLQQARSLLISSDLNISQVAYEVGFNDPAFFSRTFQEEYGTSPSEFRKEKRGLSLIRRKVCPARAPGIRGSMFSLVLILYWDAIGFVHLPSDPLDPLIDVPPELTKLA
jgi:signal transduction histidine kinase/DNA-binding response OmpR family regulator